MSSGVTVDVDITLLDDWHGRSRASQKASANQGCLSGRPVVLMQGSDVVPSDGGVYARGPLQNLGAATYCPCMTDN